MARLIWTKPALQDLNDIADYIELDNPEAARNLVKKVFSSVVKLVDFPDSGRRPPELKRTPYREKVVGPCRIFYRKEMDTVYILSVMRGERELRNYLLEERFNSENL